MVNYIPDQNKFSLAGPPQWWLRKLWDFDASLVVVPSRQICTYRLAQRRKLNLPESVTNDALWRESDTRMLATYGLVPVTTIIPTADWGNPYMFMELANRAPWRLGGASAVADRLDAEDLQDEIRKQAKTDEITTGLAKDGWALYQKKIGVRSHMYIPKTKEPGLVVAAPTVRVR